MVSEREMKYYKNHADIIEDIEKVMKHIDPTIDELVYKVNLKDGDEAIEIRYHNGVTRRVSITRKPVRAILQSLLRYVK